MPTARSQSSRSPRIWLPLALLGAALVLRVLRQHGIFADSPNLNPLMALAFAGAIVFPRSIAWWAWALILPVVDIASRGLDAQWRIDSLVSYACFVLAAYWGGRLRCRIGVIDALGGTLVCSVLFYLVTNTFSWVTEPAYAKTISGWVQALTVGVPGPYPTTLEFFRNSLVADFIGAAVLLAVYNAEAMTRKLRAMPWLGWRSGEAAFA